MSPTFETSFATILLMSKVLGWSLLVWVDMPVLELTKCIILFLKLVNVCHTGPRTHKVRHFGPSTC
jgi:hypothetical protein